MNLVNILIESAQSEPEHVALKLDDMEVSYGLLDEGSARLAAVLADRGLEPGDRVGIMLPNVPYFGVCYYGVLRAGCVVVPMNVLLKRREVAFYLGDSGARLISRLVFERVPGEDQPGAAVAEVERDLAPLEQHVHRHDDAAGAQHRVVDDRELGDVGEHHS